MKRFMIWVLVALLALVPTAPAYALEQRPRAFFEPGTDVSTPEKYAQEIERCATDATRSRATCDMLVQSFNEAFADIDDVANYKELADYFREETEVRPCPQVVTDVAHVIGDKIGYSEREMRADESCFFDTNAQRFISSAGCGQWTPKLPPTRTTWQETVIKNGYSDKPVTDSATEKAAAAGREVGAWPASRVPSYSDILRDERNYFQKHWKPIVGTGVVAGVVTWGLSKLFGSDQEVEQNQDVCIGPMCR